MARDFLGVFLSPPGRLAFNVPWTIAVTTEKTGAANYPTFLAWEHQAYWELL
jgi:hypothetical protein